MKTQWRIRNLNLVGIAKNPNPVAYLTDRGPNMKQVKDVPTRELDAFERTALEKLGAGQDLRLENHGNEIRMMAPIFAGASCVLCHEKRGRMLGAFIYEIERVPAAKSAEQSDKSAEQGAKPIVDVLP